MEKIKQWIVSHKLVSIIIASVLIVAITLAIVLPITLSNNHTFSESWSVDATSHWHACTDEGCSKTKDKLAHTFDADNKCEVCQKIKSTLTLQIESTLSVDTGAFQIYWLNDYSGGCDYDLDSYDYEYFKYGANGTLTSIGDSFPTEVGEYMVKVTYSGNETYLPVEATADFTLE